MWKKKDAISEYDDKCVNIHTENLHQVADWSFIKTWSLHSPFTIVIKNIDPSHYR